jgi:hypothetical protein
VFRNAFTLMNSGKGNPLLGLFPDLNARLPRLDEFYMCVVFVSRKQIFALSTKNGSKSEHWAGDDDEILQLVWPRLSQVPS